MLKRNITANFVGKLWTSAMALAFIPLYIKYLGIDAYGVIGVFAVLQTALGLLDLGMTPTLGREMARFIGGGHDASSIRNTLRTAECFAAACGTTAFVLVFLMAPWVVDTWLQAGELDTGSTIGAVRVMGACVGMRFVEGIYQSSMVGLQRQVLSNSLGAALATARGGGAVAVLGLVSPTLEAFFGWQAFVSACGVIAQGITTYRLLPPSPFPVRPTMEALHQMRSFAGGMIGMSVLILIITNVDKVLLSHLIDIREYGYYTLAATVAAGLSLATAPIGTAYLPQLTALHARGEDHALRERFHQGAQLISVVAGSSGVAGVVFADYALFAWTGDRELAATVTPLLRLLLVGSLFGALTHMPYFAQLAHGRIRPMVVTNSIAVLIVIPTTVLVAPYYGARGVAAVNCGLQVGYVLLAAPFMFDRILARGRTQWYLIDLALPIGAALAVSITIRVSAPLGTLSRPALILALASVGLASAISSAISAPTTRRSLMRLLEGNTPGRAG